MASCADRVRSVFSRLSGLTAERADGSVLRYPFHLLRPLLKSDRSTAQVSDSGVTMPQIDTTRVTLLARLRDAGDAGAWSQFHQLYGPVIYRYARRRGLQDADAADLTQDVLREVSQSIDRFEYCLLYTSPSPRDLWISRMPSSA